MAKLAASKGYSRLLAARNKAQGDQPGLFGAPRILRLPRAVLTRRVSEDGYPGLASLTRRVRMASLTRRVGMASLTLGVGDRSELINHSTPLRGV